jgi:serine/threonine protein kinase/Tol biopolymer transport system component
VERCEALTQSPDIDPRKWQDISGVFAAAAALEGPSRQAYLDSACQHDPGLRAAVESLLNAHNNAGSFGATPLFASSTAVKRLSPGSQLGPFRIELLLGAGGMGEVYRAYDTKLHRAVAIKVLPDFFAQHPDRLARFEEEARALAALNHPHIGAIYGVEESAGVAALVLELVEGPTLAERLTLDPLRFDEVVWIARQLAEGLEAAHEGGIVHRDLKPANIKITPDGTVKILDFGLAKTGRSLPGAASTPSTPAIARDATQFGMVLGTVGYMSPEQARGQPVDKRTDIWAFGCLLFEMCAHHPPFAGATISDAQAAVIEREPDWELLRAGTPANLVRLLRRCLTKDPKLRLRDIGEARIALEHDTDTAEVAPRSTTRRVAAIAAILATATSFAIAFAILGSPRSGPSVSPSSIRFPVPPPEGTNFSLNPGRTFFALSPDGSQLAFIAEAEAASASGGRNRLWLRPVADDEVHPVPGTDGATSVFWSPDGLSLAFFADRKLNRIDLPDGPVVPICVVEGAYSQGTWGAGGVILLGRTNGTSIDAVLASGGAPVPILTRNQSKHEERVHWPWFLPDGKRFLYTARLDDWEGEVRLAQLLLDGEGKARPVQEEGTRIVISASSNAQWVDPDVVVFVREGVLMAQHVDVEAARPLAAPFPIVKRVEYFFTSSRAMFSASLTGSVAYHSGQDIGQLVWADRNGNEVGTIGGPSEYQPYTARLSRDDSALLVARRRAGLGTFDIFRMDLGRRTERQITSNRGSEISPVWINDGSILFAGDSPGSLPHLSRKDLATGLEEPLLPPGKQQASMDVFSNGRTVAYVERDESGGFRLFQLPLARGASPTPLPLGQLSVGHMRLSPDDRAMTFVAGGGEGRMDAYVSTVPVTSLLVKVADRVSSPARWSRNGGRIYFVKDDTMMTLTVSTVPFRVGVPKQLFKLRRSASLLEVSRDGRFLLLVHQVRAAEHPITVWTAAIASTRR